ncbi:MAG: HD domain-containing protein [Patescibacteria group bacterium]
MELPKKVIDLMKKFISANAEIYIVGGAVRDMMMGREIYDWDFATNLTPEEMKKIFPKNSFCNNAFGTFSVVSGKDIYEITTYRTEKNYSDSRHPDVVEWGKTIEEDLQRRDFTINAMAIQLRITSTGFRKTQNYELRIIDLFNGQEDLKNKIIRAVGNPDERLTEDALRMMRAVRLSAQLKFKIEEKTFASIQKNAKLLQKIAGERIREELFLILKSDHPGDGMIILKNSGILEQIMPDMLLGVGMAQKGHHVYDVWKHGLETLNNCESTDPLTRLAAFLHDIGKAKTIKEINGENTFYNHEVIGSRMAVAIGKRLKLSNEELQKLFILVRWHMFTASEMQTDKAVRRFIRNVTVPYLGDMIALRRGDRIGSGARESSWRWELFKKRLIEVQKQPFSIKDLKVNGEDVMEILKIRPGRKVGEVLTKLFAEVEENPKLNEREILLEKIKKLA